MIRAWWSVTFVVSTLRVFRAEKSKVRPYSLNRGMAMIFSSKAGIFAMISSGMYRLPVLGYETSFFSYRDWAMERVLSAVRSWWMLQSF